MNAVNPIPTPAAGAEPSMEEILASIRRIIADDQPLTGAPEAAVPPVGTVPEETIAAQAPVAEMPPAEAQLDPMPTEHGTVSSPQFPTPEGTAGVMDTPHPLAPQPPEPVAETLPAASTALDDAYEISAPEPEVHEAALEALHDEPSTRAAVLGTDHLVEARIHETQIFEARVQDEQVRELLEHKVQEAAAEEPPMSLHESLREPATPPEPPKEPAAAGLFSAATSQSLAAAFNTLAISRLADNSDELRGMARDMLRPLLKDWLDANLPSLVESIIREEIEQMARRGR